MDKTNVRLLQKISLKYAFKQFIIKTMKQYAPIMALIILILLSMYSLNQHSNYYPTIKDLLDNPERYHNKITEQGGRLSLEKGTIRRGNEEIKIIIKEPLRNPKYGTVTIVGRFDKSGSIEVHDIHYSDYNNLKYFASIIGGAIFLYLFFKEWKITKRGFESARLD